MSHITSHKPVAHTAGRRKNDAPSVSKSPAGGQTAAAPRLDSLRAGGPTPTPAQLLYLQRTVGNQAVLRLVDRYRTQPAAPAAAVQAKPQDPAGLAGGPLDPATETTLRHTRTGGHPLDPPLRDSMEQSFGADFRGVRVHTDANADQLNRSLQARAFTTGSAIYFAKGQYNPHSAAGQHLLAHELTHVVQQGGGRQGVLQTKLTVGPAKDRYEEEADRVAGQVTRQLQTPGRKPDIPGPAKLQKTPALRRTPAPVVQRSLVSWFKKTFGKKTAESPSPEATPGADKPSQPTAEDAADAQNPPQDTSLQDSIEYERNLGRYIFNHPKANSAAKTMTAKMTRALVGEVDEADEEQGKKLAEIYGRNKSASAGQVGTTVKAVLDVLKEGNLRERLTAFMNALFGPFKSYVLDAMKGNQWEEMGAKGLNVDKLKRRKRQLRFNLGAKDLFRDPGNPLDRKQYGSYEYTGSARHAAKKTSARTVGELDQGPFRIGLSERERELQFPGQTVEEVQNEKLKWEEGGSYWAVNRQNKWVKKIENSLHMPVVAGPSGTMLRMFQGWEYLGKPVSAADWRLAVLGWMLTANDHSFHEMMMTAADFGLPYTPGQPAYMDIAPLSVGELRQHVAKDGLFPHEHAMLNKMKTGEIQHLLTSTNLRYAKEQVDKLSPDQRGALSTPGAAAIRLYTRFGYLIMNPTRQGGKFANLQIAHNIKKKTELSQFRNAYLEGALGTDDLMQEARDIIPVLDSALASLPDWSGELFRGTGTFNPFAYSKGATIKFGAYTSSTLNETVAKRFAKDYNRGPYKFILHLRTTAGKDVRALSNISGEDEILLPPGSAFKVVDRQTPGKGNGKAYYHVYLDQIARGGKSLKLDSDPETVAPMTASAATPESLTQPTNPEPNPDHAAPTVDGSPTTASAPASPAQPEPTLLTLYDSADAAIGTLDDPAAVLDDNTSAYTDDKGVDWVEIVTTDGQFYWTKKPELNAFLGK